MCCGSFWTALQLLWSTVYLTCGAAQLLAGIFFMISFPVVYLGFTLLSGSWNVISGIAGGAVVCFGRLSPRRQEVLLYLSGMVLAVNVVSAVVVEWFLGYMDVARAFEEHRHRALLHYACFASRTAAAVVILVSFIDSQFAFCSMQIRRTEKHLKKPSQRSHEQVADIEYIIPRTKSGGAKPHTVYDAYAQSWVFEADHATTSNDVSPRTKVLQNGTPKTTRPKSEGLQNGVILVGDSAADAHLIDNPVVYVEEASDDSASNSDRKLCHMKSFSRSASPAVLSASSSQISLNNGQSGNPAIYQCLEKLTEPQIYRSRLNTAVSTKEGEEEISQYQAPQAIMMRRVESISPNTEKVHYASLMKELQKAIGNKKEPNPISPQSISESTSASEKTQTNSNASRHESSRSEAKSSDAEFSKELEAALQLIQDLESPNTGETPSEPKESRPLAVWRHSDASESSDKTLSAVGSLGEIASPLNECQQPKPSQNGKGASIIVRYPDSQSTSGYSSPVHPISTNHTPTWSTTSSINGSNNDIVAKPLSYSIHNAKSTTVISLYSNTPQSKGKSVTLVSISGDTRPIITTGGDKSDSEAKPSTPPIKNHPEPGWKSLLRKKKLNLPKLCPELEGAIIKSESLAYLSENELLARHQQYNELHRRIEEKVIQQLGTPRTETNC